MDSTAFLTGSWGIGMHFKHILIVADIEGSSGCWSYRGSSFMTRDWPLACLGMTQDVDAVVKGLFDAGVQRITVKDFHRTGYNIIPERVDPRAKVVSGYRPGPIPGIGDPYGAEAVMFMGMHAASGTDGFLAHTLTSRIERLEVNGKPMSELELFAASLAPFGIKPIFFSGCPVACRQAQTAIRAIDVYPIDKATTPKSFDIAAWRSGLVTAAVAALDNVSTKPYAPNGFLRAAVTLRDGEATARKLARRWGFPHRGSELFIDAHDIHQLYNDLIRLCYLNPLTEKVMPLALFVYGLWGRIGLSWVRRLVKTHAGGVALSQ